MKMFRFKHHGQLPISSKNHPRSKALESVCLSRSSPPTHYDTVSTGEKGMGISISA
jgi:hypothetical protein